MSKNLPAITCCALALSITATGAAAEDSYHDNVKLKLASGFSNILLAPLEVPKNIINTSNQTNLAFGMSGGAMKGALHLLGRALSGVVDVLSAPVGNKPITNPPFVWQNWYTDTQYGPYFPVEQKKPAAAAAKPPISGATAAPAPRY